MKILKQLATLCAVTVFASIAHAANLTAQDIAEIEQLYAKYNHAIDTINGDAWADTFTPDGVFNTRFSGREALVGFVNNTWKGMGGANRRHWNSNLKLTGTAEGADGSVYLILWDVGVKPQTIFSTGIYEDKLVKTKDGWRFKTRVVKNDAPAAAAAPSAPPPAR
jgi:hypothetical protein